MILSHVAPSCFNMSPYRVDPFQANSFALVGNIFWDFQDLFFGLSVSTQSSHVATLGNILHIWEAGSRKVNMNEPDLRILIGHF